MYKKISLIITLITSLFVACCQQGQGTEQSQDAEAFQFPYSRTWKYAIVTTAATDYSSGAHSVMGYSSPRTAVNNLLSTGSDLWISAYNKNFYRIEAYATNSIIKFSMSNPVLPVWNFSTEGSENNSNPHEMVFVSDTKAYLIRYGSPKVWIVNPSATVESEFKIGELNLSAYNDSDGCPEVASGLIIGDELFLAMQRLSPSGGFPMAPVNDAYVAVFDTNTDLEIDTNLGVGLKGIRLDVRNPFAKIKHYGNYIYIAGADGTLANANVPIKGGIQKIDITTLQADPNIIEPTAQITGLEIISNTNGYFIEYDAFNDCSLRKFNPQTGYVYPGNVANIGNTGDRNLQSIIKDDDNLLWIADRSLYGSGVYIIDTANDTIQEGPISTNLDPLEITFCER